MSEEIRRAVFALEAAVAELERCKVEAERAEIRVVDRRADLLKLVES